MPKGGARPRSGPAPDPNALRRERDGDQWRELPASGREGDPPEWPLPGLSDAERDLWSDLWSLPAAVVWEEQRQELQVALYCRRLVEYWQPNAPVSLGTLVRQLAEDLGANQTGMTRYRWRVGSSEKPKVKPAARRSSSKAKLKVVAGDG